MKNKLKTMLHSVIAVGFALLLLILFEIPYLQNVSGYLMLEFYQLYGFLGFTVAFFQFFHIIAVLLLLNIGILGILQKTGVVEIKKSLKNWTYAKLVSVVLLVIASLSILELMFTIIICAKNGFYIGVGVIMNCVLEILGAVLFILLDKNGLLSGENRSANKKEPEQANTEAKEQEDETSTEKVEVEIKDEDKKEFEKLAEKDMDIEKL